jgi:hypothetical protein
MCGVNYSNVQGGYPTKSACEAAAGAMKGNPCSGGGASELTGNRIILVGVNDGYCRGSDLPVANTNGTNSPNSNIMGTDLGNPFFTPNQARTVQEWMDEHLQKMQALGVASDNAFLFPMSDNREYDRVYNDNAVAYLGKSGSPVYKHPDQLKVNMGIQGTIPPKEDDGKRYMQMYKYERQISIALEELKQIEKFCASPLLDCEYYRERKEKAEQSLKEATAKILEMKSSELREEISRYTQELEKYAQQLSICQTEFCKESTQKSIDYLNGKIEETEKKLKGLEKSMDNEEKSIKNRIDERNSLMSHAEKQCEIALEMIEMGDKTAGMALWARYAPIVASENMYKKGSEIAKDAADAVKDGIGTLKDMRTGKYENDPEVRKYHGLTYASLYGTASNAPGPQSKFLGMLSDAIEQKVNHGSVNPTELVSNVAKGAVQDAALGQVAGHIEKKIFDNIPIVSAAISLLSAAKDGTGFVKNVGMWYNAVEDARNSDPNKSNK